MKGEFQMNLFKSLTERVLKGSSYIKSKMLKPDFSKSETKTEETELHNKKEAGSNSSNKGDKQVKDLVGALKSSKNKGNTLLGFIAGQASDSINKIIGIFKKKPVKPEEETPKEPAPVFGPTREDFELSFKQKQDERNRIIVELEEKLKDWEKEIANDNGLLEVDFIPFDILSEDPDEFHERITEYDAIINNAEEYIQERLIKGYDDFLNMLTYTILPDMNEGFMEELKEAFRTATLEQKSAFLEAWWKEMRENYDDLKSGSETLWGLEIQETVAKSMIDSLRG